jgi:uncharacterized protein (DUF433 family)
VGSVSSVPGVLGGTPVFNGTRIPVHDIADISHSGPFMNLVSMYQGACG